MQDVNTFLRCKNGTDLFYHHAELGGSEWAAGEVKRSMFVCFFVILLFDRPSGFWMTKFMRTTWSSMRWNIKIVLTKLFLYLILLDKGMVVVVWVTLSLRHPLFLARDYLAVHHVRRLIWNNSLAEGPRARTEVWKCGRNHSFSADFRAWAATIYSLSIRVKLSTQVRPECIIWANYRSMKKAAVLLMIQKPPTVANRIEISRQPILSASLILAAYVANGRAFVRDSNRGRSASR